MIDRPKAVFCWSGGKDSAFCLSKVLEERLYDIKYLLTTLNERFKRVSMHGIREELLDQQTASIGIPLLKVSVSEGTNVEYERQMESVLLGVQSKGIHHVIFGDIYLEDLRQYREKNLAKIGMEAVFPLWKMDTRELAKEFISQHFQAIVCCTNDAFLGKEWLGRRIDDVFLQELPNTVDPCGENGEYHTFCYEGSIFRNKIKFTMGDQVFKPLELLEDDHSQQQFPTSKGFWYCDLLPMD
jgi:uncharacterized protein (TIGR00290 family)